MPTPTRHRIAVRAIIVHDERLLLVNAWPEAQSDMWCAPGGGVELHDSLPDNLKREVFEETGLRIDVGPPVLINEFHDPKSDFHQVDIFFRCTLITPDLPDSWTDPDGVVTLRKFFSKDEVSSLRVKPDGLAQIAWNEDGVLAYDPLEPLQR